MRRRRDRRCRGRGIGRRHSDAAGDTLVEERRRDADADHADADFRATTFQQAQPQSNHNGGMLAFGSDGMLYLGLGDGDGSDDQHPPPSFGSDLAGEVYVVDFAGTVFRVEAAPP